jgi:hypothetical protein
MSIDHNRLLLRLEQAMRDINRAEITAELPELSFNDLNPVLSMVARSRAAYLKEWFQLASCDEGSPSDEQIDRLRRLRLSFEEQVAGAQALETAIQRGYLNVMHHS